MGLGLRIFTAVHVIISLVGIVSGFVAIAGLLARKRMNGWNALFLASTVATSVTGFFFPVHRFMPSHGVGIVSLLVLPVAIVARYRHGLVGHWRVAYVTAGMFALYLNVFVLVAQSFAKVPALKALAPTQSEPPFLVAQLIVLAAFAALTVIAALRSRAPQPRLGSLALQVA
jgi:hypothetical protein